MIRKEAFLINDVPHIDDLKTKILPYRAQEKIMNEWLEERLDTILADVMIENKIDAWVVACNEYNEDPIFNSLVPKALMTARRLTILLFHLNEDNIVKRYAITRPNIGLNGLYEEVWLNQKDSIWCKDPLKAESQFECLNRILEELNVSKIGLNISKHFAFGDGLSKSLYDEIYNHLSDKNREKLCSAEYLCVGWLERRCKSEIAAYPSIMAIAHSLISEAFSSRVVTPGVTTNLDVKYYMLQKVIDLGLMPWFDFEVSIIRPNKGQFEEEMVIMPGDILHCDVGLKYLGLCTDTQENAYVLKTFEEDAPLYLKECLSDTNRFQDIVLNEFKVGRSGNEILKASLNKAKEEGLKPCLYTHPIGNHGHGAGVTIGLYDKQQGVKVNGDYILHNDTAYSLELNCAFYSEEMGFEFTLGLETDILFTDSKTYYMAGRQTNFHLIK